jgi:hypothetical protein
MLLARPDRAALSKAAEAAGTELGWDEARRRDEIRSVQARWHPEGER